MNKNKDKLNLAFYDASDGPRIMLFGPLTGDFESLQKLFRTMSHCQGWVELHRQPFIDAFGNIRLLASCSGSLFHQPGGKPQGVRRKPFSIDVEFEWQRTAEGWDYLGELIDELVKSPTPGHQYLSAYPREDAIVVVSKGEYGEEVLERLRQELPRPGSATRA